MAGPFESALGPLLKTKNLLFPEESFSPRLKDGVLRIFTHCDWFLCDCEWSFDNPIPIPGTTEFVIYKGWLQKSGTGRFAGFKKRFFVLTFHALLYFDKEDVSKCKGDIPLESILMIEHEKGITTHGKTFPIKGSGWAGWIDRILMTQALIRKYRDTARVFSAFLKEPVDVALLANLDLELKRESRHMKLIANDWTLLHLAADRDDPGAVKVLVTNFKYRVDEEDKNGETPLIVACRAKNFECTKLLISLGANVEAMSNAKVTPVVAALQLHGKQKTTLKLIKMLAMNGANFSERTIAYAIERHQNLVVSFMKRRVFTSLAPSGHGGESDSGVKISVVACSVNGVETKVSGVRTVGELVDSLMDAVEKGVYHSDIRVMYKGRLLFGESRPLKDFGVELNDTVHFFVPKKIDMLGKNPFLDEDSEDEDPESDGEDYRVRRGEHEDYGPVDVDDFLQGR
eukprot:TRINITY_DN2473_c0_g1_i1.p1 TRINITY_DN2473_c0_g1~~TRINITY_DN2473_c0_g1_i1.p1  ORF type:complete len:457 (+),score=115.65 TRINITY_DN2473_c0_g1_i1:117-1487(+)